MSSILRDDLEDLLSCSICLDTLTEPKLLPCSHRFCKSCLACEINRSATNGVNPSFPCPLCKRRVPLSKGKGAEDWVRRFESDRLLNAVLERLGDEKEATPDVCGPHRARIEIICYTCKKTGCIRCAWEKHRACSKTEIFKTTVDRVERDLKHHFQLFEKRIRTLDSLTRNLTSIKKSIENQVHYSNKFVDQCIQTMTQRYRAQHSHVVTLFESYLRNASIPRVLKKDINTIMQTFQAKLDIDSKCEEAVLHLKKQNSKASVYVSNITRRMQSLPDEQHIGRIPQHISKILQMNKSKMVFAGEKLLTALRGNVYEQFDSDEVGASPGSLIQEGLITSEDQVNLDIEEEQKLLWELFKLMETAHDPRQFLAALKKLQFPHEPNSHLDAGSAGPIVPASFHNAPSRRNNQTRNTRVTAGQSSHLEVPLHPIFPPLLTLQCPRCKRLVTYVLVGQISREELIYGRGRHCPIDNEESRAVNERRNSADGIGFYFFRLVAILVISVICARIYALGFVVK